METINITITREELELIGQALSQLPYAVVADLIVSLAKQARVSLAPVKDS